MILNHELIFVLKIPTFDTTQRFKLVYMKTLKNNINHSVAYWPLKEDGVALEDLLIALKRIGMSAVDLVDREHWDLLKKYGFTCSLCKYDNVDYTKAWIYHEKGYKKELGEVDGVSGATINSHLQGYAKPIEVSHEDPSKQALMDFRDAIYDNKIPISNVHTGAKTAMAVQGSLDAMYNEEIVYWN